MRFNPYTWPHKDRPVRMSGQRTDLYQATVESIVAHAKVADRCGFEGIFNSEQHGNVEGIPEVTGNPILTSMFIAGETERVKVGQLSNALTVHNPLLIADQIAQLDQLTKGRVLAGFARGNTTRWADQYGQHISMGATLSDKSAHDERNFRCLQECWEIVKLAWTRESFSFEGEFWTFPVPGTKWPYPHTPTYGTGVDDDGIVTEVSIAPRPFQDPHPRVFAPMSGRAQTVRFWAREGASVVCLTDREDLVNAMLGYFAEEAEAAGRDYKRGQGMVLGGNFAIDSNESVARERGRAMLEWDAMVYGVPPYNLPNPMQINGTPQQIIDQVGAVHEKFGTEEFIILADFPAPHGADVSLEMLEQFGTEVLPAFGVKAPDLTLA
jgi:alkanesulfonate monooxygenase SsuD/methylene tetrahydromethanopterin reductase-like flavin-dependent oxidoreductase (luciferase family)